MHVGFRVSFAALAVLAATVSVAAFQTDASQKPGASSQIPTEPQHADVPQWPYPQDPQPGSPMLLMDGGQPHHVPGSSKTYTLNEVDATASVDWFPDTHPKAPTGVADGKPTVYFSCGSCHLMDGHGIPETQGLNGLPVAYMQQQFDDMKSDLRHTSANIRLERHMIALTKHMPEADSKDAIAYFNSIGPTKWIRVVETETVSKTIPGVNAVAAIDPSGAKEPIGNRIIELPENYDRSRLHDPTSGFVAYVPPGSVAKGEALVKTGAGGRTVACATCHGADLHGMGGIIPPITGRSPTATGRQLYDFKTGARHGKNSPLMKPTVQKLTDEDIVDISAYLASLPQ